MKKILHKDQFSQIIENFVIIIILLAIILTIVEDLGAIYNWPFQTMSVIMITGFGFDLFFTMEFIARSIISIKRKQFGYYMKYQRGWVDALSSIPLLLLVSGPFMLLHFGGNNAEVIGFEFFSLLKTAKIIRVTRVLRLIRVLKLFGKIHNTDSNMANRHMATISTISVVTLMLVLVITQFAPFARVGDHEEYLKERKKDLTALLSEPGRIDWIRKYIENSPSNQDIIELSTNDGEVLYINSNRFNLIHKAYNLGKPIKINDKYSVILSYFPAEANHAKSNMIIFISILAVISSILFVYSRLFVQQVTDPIYVMNKGFRNWNYNLTVKDNENYPDEEVFELARVFNSKWLPLKNQIRAYRQKKQGIPEKSSIKMDDLF